MTSTELYARSLLDSHLLRGPALATAIAFLDLPPGSRGLDAGCGIGLHTTLLAQAVQPGGHVVGLDVSPALLAWSSTQPAAVSLAGGAIQQLPFRDNAFDWLWSVDTVYPGAVVAEPSGVLAEFRRVVKPGGRIALLFWSAQKLLPGYPQLEAALDAAFATTVPYWRPSHPNCTFSARLAGCAPPAWTRWSRAPSPPTCRGRSTRKPAPPWRAAFKCSGAISSPIFARKTGRSSSASASPTPPTSSSISRATTPSSPIPCSPVASQDERATRQNAARKNREHVH